MNRKILFRGFNEDPNGNEEIELDGKIIKGKWVEGFYWNNGVNNHFIKQLYSDDEYKKITLLSYEVIPETVSQYTGLNDMNGKKIFENAVVYYNDFANPYRYEITGNIVFTQNCMFEIEYDDKYVKNIKSTRPLVCHEHPIFTSKKVKVIGTIFDKKEVSDE